MTGWGVLIREETRMQKWSVLILVINEKGKTTHKSEHSVKAPDQADAIESVIRRAPTPATPTQTLMVSAAPDTTATNEPVILIDIPQPDWTPELKQLYSARETSEEAEEEFLDALELHDDRRRQSHK